MNSFGFCSRCGNPLDAGAKFCGRCGNDVSGQQPAAATVRVATPPPTVDPWLELQQKLVRATVGEYEIMGEIGRGGMASVYLAHDIALDRKVAIKVMSPDLFRDAAMADRFKREARTAASLSHPHIIHIYAVKQQADILYFVMELIRGRPLDVLLREAGQMPLPMAQMLLAQIGGALGYAHRRGIVHRDVKPANVMVDEEGKAIVTDFGIAKVAEAKGLTMTGATIGTPSYMSPEQCNAREVTGASDQYSLGIMAFEMFAGRTPFQADTLMGIMYQHFNEPPPPLASFRPDLPPNVLAAVQRMLGKKAEDRYPKIEDAVQALGNVVLGHDDPHLLQLIKWVESGSERQRLVAPTPPRSPVPPGRPSAAATTPVPPSSAGANPPATVAVPVAALVVEPADTEVHVGESVMLRAYPRDGHGGTLTGRRISWTSATPAIATVDAQGRVTAVGEGVAAVTATCEGRTASAQVSVLAVPVGGIVVAPAGGRVVVGETLRLVASVQTSAGASLTGRRVTWTSGAPATATVDPDGVVRGLSAGSVTITATCDKVSAPVQVVVLAQPVAALRLDDPLGGKPLGVGQSVRLRAVPLDAAGNPLADREVAWVSSAPGTVEVTADGVATALIMGRAKISASCEGIRSAIEFVVPVPAADAEAPTAKVKGVRAPGAAPAKSRSARAPERSKLPLIVGAVVVVLVGAVGSYVMFGRRAPATVAAPGAPAATVPADTKVASLYILPGSTSLAVGDTLAARLVARNAADSQLAIGDGVQWRSSNAAVASVSATGLVKVVGGGQANITASYAGQAATLSLTGTTVRAPVASVSVQAPRAPIWIGDTLTLVAELKDPAGANLGGRTVSWSSSAPRTLKIDGAGRVTALAAGRVTLTATAEGKRATLLVDVTPVPTGRVVLDPVEAKVDLGQTLSIHARVTDPRGRPLDRPVTWRSSAPAIASITTAGLLKGEAVGAAKVTAEVDGVRADLAVTVAAPTKVAVQAPAPQAAPTPASQGVTAQPSLPVVSAPNTPASNPSTSAATSTPAAPASAGFTAEVIGSGGAQSCALRSGEPWCWGAGRATPARSGPPKLAQLSVGVAHACGIVDARLFCWGANGKGQLGNNSTTAGGPVEVGAGTGWRSVAAGTAHTCAVSVAGRVFCWGDNKNGQLGDGTTSDRRVPTPIAGIGSTKFTQVAVGQGHTCALAETGRAWCWGDGFAGQLGTGVTQVAPDPTEVSGRTSFTKLALGDSHSCGLTAGGQVWCWGGGQAGQVGDGTTNDRNQPVQVRSTESFADLAAGGSHTCAVTRGGQVFCWGSNAAGQLGDGSRAGKNRPTLAAVQGTFTTVAAGAAHTCANGPAGVFCWGEGRQGQLGDGLSTARPTPAAVPRG